MSGQALKEVPTQTNTVLALVLVFVAVCWDNYNYLDGRCIASPRRVGGNCPANTFGDRSYLADRTKLGECKQLFSKT